MLKNGNNQDREELLTAFSCNFFCHGLWKQKRSCLQSETCESSSQVTS